MQIYQTKIFIFLQQQKSMHKVIITAYTVPVSAEKCKLPLEDVSSGRLKVCWRITGMSYVIRRRHFVLIQVLITIN